MGKRKKKRTHAELNSGKDDDKTIPRSFVFKRGKVPQEIVQLVHDMRDVMAPYTALKLKETKRNQLKDFLNIGPTMGVTHFMVFAQTTMGTNLRLIRIPHGPTLTFRVQGYSLMRDIVNIQKRPHSHGPEFLSPPLVVLNNFSGAENHKQIMAAMFQNMFPAINVRTVKLSECRRVVLLNFSSETNEIEFRHYVVNASPVGLTKSVKRIIKAKIPNLNKLEDISQYVEGDLGGGMSSDSEAEDTPETRVTLSQDFKGRGNKKSHRSALRLKELGPRLTLKLLKIEEEFCDGKVLYHSLVSRTDAEAEELEQKRIAKEKIREERRKKQEEIVKLKEEKKQEKKDRKKKRQKMEDGEEGESEDSMDDVDDHSDDDIEEEEEEASSGDDENESESDQDNAADYDGSWNAMDENEQARKEAVRQMKQGAQKRKR